MMFRSVAAFDQLGRALKALRESKQMTQDGLGTAIGLSNGGPQVSRYERGLDSPGAVNLSAMLDAMGVSPWELARELDAVNDRDTRPAWLRPAPPADPAEIATQASQPMNLASLDVVTALLGDLRDALNGLDLPRRGPSLVPPTQRDRDP